MACTAFHPRRSLARTLAAGQRLAGMPEPMHVWAGADGVPIAADAWGDPQGPLVLLLHGAGQTRHAWGGTGALLGKAGYRSVAFDARGHGDSGWPADGLYSQDAMVRDLECVIAALGGRTPALIGASMGGGTSLVAVGEGRVEASALILVDIVPHTEPEGVDRIRAFMEQKAEGFDSLEEVADAIGRYRPHRARPGSLDGLSKNVRLGADGKYRWHWDPRFLAAPRDFQQRYQRLCACTRKLALPTLLVRGGSSDVVSEEGVREFLSLCPHAQYAHVHGAGHMVAGDRNDAFGLVAIDFLAGKLPVGAEAGHAQRRSGPA